MMNHLAILHILYLDKILNGEKTCESRFTKNKIAPYRQILPGDIIFLKETGGDILAKGIVSERKFFQFGAKLQPIDIFNRYNHEICANQFFIEEKKDAKYCTLIWFSKIELLNPPLKYSQNGRSAWIVNPPHFQGNKILQKTLA
jgi:ASC-1-like (ASCH) protein